MRIAILTIGALLAIAPCRAQSEPIAVPPDSTVHGESFRMECSRCHTPEGWRVLRPDPDFDHAAETGFELRGAHADVRCRDCHADPIFSRIGVLCADCHTDVVHRGELGFDCARCHEEHDWRLSANLLLEHQQTRFPLVGRHALVDCGACHTTTQQDEYAGLSTECVHCHLGDYTASRSPDHARIGLPIDCDQCHSVADLFWSEAVFQHPGSFPLMFGHAIDDCAVCHTAINPNPVGTDCFGCHAETYSSVPAPDHVSGGFPTDCTLCHDVTGFSEVPFYAHVESGFSMEGRHGTIFCAACHASGVYSGLPAQCYGCHQDDYENTQDPDHIEVEFPISCERCHTPATWYFMTGSFPRGAR